MAALRETGDALELTIPHESWPLADVSRDAVHQVETWQGQESAGAAARTSSPSAYPAFPPFGTIPLVAKRDKPQDPSLFDVSTA